jgi:hypothetical protein
MSLKIENSRRVAESRPVCVGLRALIYSFQTVLNSYESKYESRFPYNNLFQTDCLVVVLTSPSYMR